MNVLKGIADVFSTRSAPRGLTGALGTPLPWFPTTKAFRETCSHFTDLPNDPDLENTLCEVHYIHHTLRYYLLPTTLPDDNLELCKKMLRSLESRRDLTSLVLKETSILDTIFGISQFRKPPPYEPPDLQRRVVSLNNHWKLLNATPTPLSRGYATSHSPPLMQRDYELTLTLEQAAEAELHYRLWRTNRDRKVSYLKGHPPEPIKARMVTRGEIASDAVWEALPWTPEEMSKAPDDRQMKFEPLYQPIESQAVPLDWVNPGSPPVFTTPEEERRWGVVRRRFNERKDRQVEHAKKLMAEKKGQGAARDKAG
ncbi:hypothetical protein NCS57_01076000 [Fusarium keratoplasticum]|uniref:Uncharacterized protein n=1 Tax=Fusarium keratoplasticum TaxID=1328300 RepID=A0ACC0QNU7_9HYPO|nr:hypothetical protein NCS57_01076000 [Fusarium keratoplasticum]KAI8660970.1 hypothetical protein NCS57_01076000 [Fusarium keratoplasticum]KAI8661988.1 hypothetical protein NCS55_01071000 [Fusarium keratoplasticum]